MTIYDELKARGLIAQPTGFRVQPAAPGCIPPPALPTPCTNRGFSEA